LAAGVVLILVVQTEIISIVSTLPWALYTEWLVICNVGSKATKLSVWQSFHDINKLAHVVFPTKPSAMRCIKVQRGVWGFFSKFINSIFNSFFVRTL
jgi:hypothetical protein